jgi:hypothetical protein
MQIDIFMRFRKQNLDFADIVSCSYAAVIVLLLPVPVAAQSKA